MSSLISNSDNAKVVKFTHIQNDTFIRAWTFTDSNNQPIDMRGSEFDFSVKSSYSDATPVIQCNLENGKAVAVIPPNGTTYNRIIVTTDDFSIPSGEYVHDATVIIDDARTTITKGSLILSESV